MMQSVAKRKKRIKKEIIRKATKKKK